MIQFTTPWILWGAVAATLPILIHLFGRRKTKQVAFSSLRFLQKLRQDQIRRLRLRQILLLALRTLMILLLVLAFAGPRYAPSGASGIAHDSAVFLFDNTISSSAEYEGRSILEQLKEYAGKIAGNREYVQSFVWTSVMSPDQSFINTSPEVPDEFIANLSPEYGTVDMSGRLERLRSWLTQQRIGDVDLFILTDGQRDQYRGLAEEELSGWDGSRIFVISPNAHIRQSGLEEVQLERALLQPGGTIPLEMQIIRSDSASPMSTAIQLRRDGSKIGQTLLNWDMELSRRERFEVPIQDPGFLRLEISLGEDAYRADNHWYANVQIPGTIRVLLVTDSPDAGLFAQTALESVADERSAFSFETIPSSNINGSALESADMVILSDVVLNDTRQRYLRDAVESGTGVMYFPGNSVRQAEDFQLFDESPVFGQYTALSANQYQEVSQVNWDHPVFRDLTYKEPSVIQLPRVSRYFTLTGTVSGVLMRLNSGAPFLTESQFGEGRIWTWSSGLSLEWTDLPRRGILIPLLVRGAYYLSGRQQAYENQLLTGEPIVYNIENVSTGEQLRLITPSGQSVILPVNEPEIRYEDTHLPGHYGVYHQEKLLALYSVNVQKGERNPHKLAVDEWQVIFGEKFGAYIQAGDSGALARGAGLVQGRPLWHWLFALTLACLITEMIISRTGTTRQRSDSKE